MIPINYEAIFQKVLEDLVRVTHCHGCGKKINVCFFGYVGEYCRKYCYKRISSMEDDTYEGNEEKDILGHDPDTCGWCNSRRLSNANSLYHRIHYGLKTSNGIYWPMKNTVIPCQNSCIRERPTLRLKGYNCTWKPPVSA